MIGFPPNLFDKLMFNDLAAEASSVLKQYSLEQYKDSVLRDLEALLNTRAVFKLEDVGNFPECTTSILTYGIEDFAHLSLSSSDHCYQICRSIENGIMRHEPRLIRVRAMLDANKKSVNSIHFNVSATLSVFEINEQIRFNAVLQPATFSYSILKRSHSQVSGQN